MRCSLLLLLLTLCLPSRGQRSNETTVSPPQATQNTTHAGVVTTSEPHTVNRTTPLPQESTSLSQQHQTTMGSTHSTTPSNHTSEYVAALEAKVQGLVTGIIVLGIALLLLIISLIIGAVYLRRNYTIERRYPIQEQRPPTLFCDISVESAESFRLNGKQNGVTFCKKSQDSRERAGRGTLVVWDDGGHLGAPVAPPTGKEQSKDASTTGEDSPSTSSETVTMATTKRNKSLHQGNRGTTSKTFTAIFGDLTVDIFSDITDTNQLLPLYQYYHNDEVIHGEPVRESIIEKVTIVPLGLEGVINEGFESDEGGRPTSYFQKTSARGDSQTISTDSFGSFKEDTQYSLVDEVLQQKSVDDLNESLNTTSDSEENIELSNLNTHPQYSDAPFPNASDYNQGMFTRKTIGPSGGQIKLLEVKLDIPAGALTNNKEICLGILWQKNVFPKLSRKQTVLSPIIVCEPHSLRFNKPVKLTLPHCAHDVRQNWDITPLKSETTVNQVPSWKPLTLEDYDERVIGDNCVQIGLYHFTLYTIIGGGKGDACAAKCINMVAFAPPLEPGKFFKIRLYCTNYYTEEKELEKVRQGELEVGGKRLNVASKLIVHDNDKNLCSSLENLSEGWTADCDKIDIDFETMWHGFTPSCEFVIRPAGCNDTITCDVKTFQDGRPEKASCISIAEQAKHNIFGNIPLTTFPDDLCRFLIVHLDIANPLHRDWRALAEHLNMDATMVTWIEQRQQSPTEFILQQWEKQKRSLKSFYTFMKEIDRQDVAEEIDKYL